MDAIELALGGAAFGRCEIDVVARPLRLVPEGALVIHLPRATRKLPGLAAVFRNDIQMRPAIPLAGEQYPAGVGRPCREERLDPRRAPFFRHHARLAADRVIHQDGGLLQVRIQPSRSLVNSIRLESGDHAAKNGSTHAAPLSSATTRALPLTASFTRMAACFKFGCTAVRSSQRESGDHCGVPNEKTFSPQGPCSIATGVPPSAGTTYVFTSAAGSPGSVRGKLLAVTRRPA